MDAERATTGQSEADAVDFLLNHLIGAARAEVCLRPAEEGTNPAAVFKILRGTFGEGLTEGKREYSGLFTCPDAPLITGGTPQLGRCAR